ncbi:MAG: NifB/NifX family molybdenum-iron cluster-binding protein [Desulfobacterales bacterium]
MKVAISSTGNDLSASLDPRFGRCPYFVIVDTEDMTVEAIANEAGARGGGAGIEAARQVAAKKVGAVITGNCGPNAVQTLNAAGIQLYSGQAGTIREVVERFNRGGIEPTTAANAQLHAGTGGKGMGGGRGMGMGRRRGSGG